MGNVLRSLCGSSYKHDHQQPSSLGPHGVTVSTVGVSALARDIFYYEISSKVPEGLSGHVTSSRKAQANWFQKLLVAWKEAKPPPQTPEESARLVIQSLNRHKKEDVKGLLIYYGLPLPDDIIISDIPLTLPGGVKFEFETLPVDGKAVADGDTVTVYVSTADSRESANVPLDVHEAAVKMVTARARGDNTRPDALHMKIVDAGYRVLNGPDGQTILAKKYRIRLRGIDAPEKAMPYGKEAHQELQKLIQGKCLKIHVYGEDRYGRTVGDIYCNGIFVQEFMLKNGLAWHYAAYDERSQLSEWQREARAARVGLWALPNPEEPWDWRRQQRNGEQIASH